MKKAREKKINKLNHKVLYKNGKWEILESCLSLLLFSLCHEDVQSFFLIASVLAAADTCFAVYKENIVADLSFDAFPNFLH